MKLELKFSSFLKLFVVGTLSLLQIISIVLHVRNGSTVHWAVAFIPLWILNMMILFYMLNWALTKYKTGDQETSWTVVILLFTLFVCSTIFEVLLSVNLTHPGTYSVVNVYIPLILFTVILIVSPIIYKFLACALEDSNFEDKKFGKHRTEEADYSSVVGE
jgi:hypothetical protein